MQSRLDETAAVDLGARVRYFRARVGITQEALARAAKLTPKFVSQIENGRVNPSIAVVERLVRDGFRISLGVFFMWEPDRADVSAMLALLARQPADYHRRIVRAIEALCEHDPAGRPSGEHLPARRR